MDQHGMNFQREFAKKSGLKDAALSNILNGKVRKPNKETLSKIMAVIGNSVQNYNQATTEQPMNIRISMPVKTLKQALEKATEYGHIVIENNGRLFDVRKLS